MLGKVATVAANTALLLGSANQYRQWKRAANHIADAQLSVLLRILERNADTSFGREHGFQDITSVAEYQRAAPLSSYEDCETDIARMAGGESNVLTGEPVILFEPTSGSTSASKLIPYTKSLKLEFQRGIGPWLYTAFTTWPSLLTGKQYWSITPIDEDKPFTDGGIPIGFEEDSEYFGALKKKFIQTVMAVPPAVRRIQDRETFRYLTLLYLLQCRDLSLISVWNPTFLLLLLEGLPRHAPSLISDIAEGTLTPPNAIATDLKDEIVSSLRQDPGRARELESLLGACNNDPLWRDSKVRALHEAIWPKLALISCWADGHSAEYAAALAGFFPNTPIQPKGLLATEGFVSFPLGRKAGAALALTSHFFEFVEADSGGDTTEVRLAQELELGQIYSVVITTGGGLYRYRLHDLVEVTGFEGDCPMVRFVGKEDAVVDLFGEKLNESHVRCVAAEQFASHGPPPAFWVIAPEKDGDYSGHYTLFAQWRQSYEDGASTENLLKKLVAGLEKGLQENYHYRYCRELGQLNQLRGFLIPAESGNAGARFLEACSSLGQRLGDVKPVALHGHRGLSGVFPGKYVGI